MNQEVQLLFFLLITSFVIGFPSRNPEPAGYKISITNPSEATRISETIEVSLEQLPDIFFLNTN